MNPIMQDEDKDYHEVRKETVCRGCGKPKSQGLIVCWGCFKYSANPFKYFRNDIPGEGCRLDLWLEEIGGNTA